MNTKWLRIGLVVVAMTALAPAARSQDITAQMVSWFTGDPSVLEGPTCAGPTNYAEDTCCGDGTCGHQHAIANRHERCPPHDPVLRLAPVPALTHISRYS